MKMNLNAYDVINPKINKAKTWVDVNKHQLLSREFKYRQYVTISKRYNKENNNYEYFIILLDDYPQNRPFSKTKRDNYGRIKISLNSIWQESSLSYYNFDSNVNVDLVDSADDGDIYKLDI